MYQYSKKIRDKGEFRFRQIRHFCANGATFIDYHYNTLTFISYLIFNTKRFRMASQKKRTIESSVPVDIYATFVSAKAGGDPKLRIDNPENLSDVLTGITCDGYDDLLEALDEFVDDEENEMSFHFDKAHLYRIDGRVWEHGTAIYGRKNK